MFYMFKHVLELYFQFYFSEKLSIEHYHIKFYYTVSLHNCY